MGLKSIVLGAAALGVVATASATDIGEISGDWRTVRHGADIRIEDCGNGTPCGVLVSVGTDVPGTATTDERNRNQSLRSRSLEGLPILWGYQTTRSGWGKGRLYNPETGQTFRSSIEVVSRDQLRVSGCLGPLCRSQVWTRITPTDTLKDKPHDPS